MALSRMCALMVLGLVSGAAAARADPAQESTATTTEAKPDDAKQAPEEPKQEPAETKSDDWRFKMTPYFWATGLSGSIGVNGLPPESFGQSFSELVNNLDMALAGAVEVRKGHWSLLLDATWAKLSTSTSTPQEVGYSSAGVTVAETIFNSVLGYRLPGPERLDWSVIAGIRFFNLDATMNLEAGTLPSTSESETRNFVDPVFGLTATYWFSEHWFATALADVGGFGVGSHFTSQLFGVAGYQFCKLFSTTLGYRAIFVNYSSSGFTFDVWEQGLFLGLGFSFSL